MWNLEGGGTRGAGVRKDWITEGNVNVYMFKNEADRVSLLLEALSPEQVAKKKKISVEEARELMLTQLLWERWIQPVPFWEHSIPEIPQVRFFGTVVCPGRTCPLCAENSKAKEQGVTENKLLPFPVRRRFVAPIWNYRLKQVLYLRQNQDFYSEMGVYVEKNGTAIDFDVFKTGRGLNTKYKAVFLGASQLKGDEKVELILPKDLDFTISPQELEQKLGKRGGFPPADASRKAPQAAPQARQESPAAPAPQNQAAPPAAEAEEPGQFVIPFGTHKGKTIQALWDEGNRTYLQFLSTRSSGPVNEKVQAFLASHDER